MYSRRIRGSSSQTETTAALAARAHAVEVTEARTAGAENARNEFAIEMHRLVTELEALRARTTSGATPLLSEVCKAILSPSQLSDISSIRSIDKLGLEAGSVGEMGDKRRRDLAKITNMLLSTVLDVAKAGAKDPGGILRAISELRGASSTSLGVALTEQSSGTSTQNSVLPALANAYRKSIKANDKRTARSILSVLVSSALTDKEVISLCSECSPIVAGDTVSVLLHANARRNMIALAVADEGIKVVTIANALSSQGENSDFEIVPAKNVRVLGLVTCTLDQIKVAKLHAAVHYPGAKVTSVITRAGGISPERASFVAEFLRDKTVCEASEASLVNSSRGVVYRLKQRRWPLWHRLVLLMLTANLQPVSWGHFWWLTSTSQYELLTADNCCCGICRDLGFDNYDELRDIITKLAGAIAAVSEGVVTIEVALHSLLV